MFCKKLNVAIQTRNAIGFNNITYEMIILFYWLAACPLEFFKQTCIPLTLYRNISFWIFTVTQRLEQMNSSLSANIISNIEQLSQNIF